MLVYVPRIGGITITDELPDGNDAAMFGFMFLMPKLYDPCTKKFIKLLGCQSTY
jgi:hypothetical protein